MKIITTLILGLLTLGYLPLAHSQNENARAQAPIDITGNWVSLVTEGWRLRILTGEAGYIGGYELTELGRSVAESWDPQADTANGEACKSYGAGGLMRQPTRLQIDWENDNVLRIETDAGMQTRMLKFGLAQDGEGAGTWQGVSNAHWEAHGQNPDATASNGTLAVETGHMRSGYLLRNGIPYSEQAVMQEYFEIIQGEDGTEYLVVVSIVEDPVFLSAPAITSSNFRREADDSDWSPTECLAD